MSSKLIICTMFTVALSGTYVWGQACNNTYTGPDLGDWQNNLYWSEGHWPKDTEVACIPAGKIVQVWEGR